MSWFSDLFNKIDNYFNPPMPAPVIKEITEPTGPRIVTGYIQPMTLDKMNAACFAPEPEEIPVFSVVSTEFNPQAVGRPPTESMIRTDLQETPPETGPRIVTGYISPIRADKLIFNRDANPKIFTLPEEPKEEFIVPQPNLDALKDIVLPNIPLRQPLLEEFPPVVLNNKIFPDDKIVSSYWTNYAYPTTNANNYPEIYNFKTVQRDGSESYVSRDEPLDKQKYLQDAAYYIWLETDGDSQWCWDEALRRNPDIKE